MVLCVCRASDKCQKEKRKTINGDDLLWAMATLGFEDYIDPLKSYLTRYREVSSFPIFSSYVVLHLEDYARTLLMLIRALLSRSFTYCD